MDKSPDPTGDSLSEHTGHIYSDKNKEIQK